MAIFRNDFLACVYLESLDMLRVRNGHDGRLSAVDRDEDSSRRCCWFCGSLLFSVI